MSVQTPNQNVAAFLAEVGAANAGVTAYKTAAELDAVTKKMQGGNDTTHPSNDVDNGTMAPNKGELAKKNDATLKESVPAGTVDKVAETLARLAKPKAAEGGAGRAADEDGGNLQIGTTKLPTGKDPGNETAGATGKVMDQDTTHPAAANNTSVGQAKYAYDPSAPAAKTAAMVAQDANEILAWLANSLTNKQAAVATPTSVDQASAAQAGLEFAALASGTLTKEAAEKAVQAHIAAQLKAGHEDALAVLQLLDGVEQGLTTSPVKRAGDDEGSEGESESKSESAPKKESAPPSDGGSSGGPPAGGGGGPPPAADPGMGGGGAEAKLQALEAQLSQMGMTVDDLIQSLSAAAAGGGGGGGDPSMGGGAGAPPAPAPMPGPAPGGDPLAGGGMGGGAPPPAPSPMEVQAAARTHTTQDKIATVLRELIRRK